MRIVALLLALTTGCSWMSSRPVHRYQNGSVDCSTSRGAAGVDTTVAVATGIGTLGTLAGGEPAGALLLGGVAALYIASAAHGYKQAGECREAIEGLAMQTESEPDDRRAHWVAPRETQTDDADDDSDGTSDDVSLRHVPAADTPPAPPKAKVELEIDASELEGAP